MAEVENSDLKIQAVNNSIKKIQKANSVSRVKYNVINRSNKL